MRPHHGHDSDGPATAPPTGPLFSLQWLPAAVAVAEPGRKSPHDRSGLKEEGGRPVRTLVYYLATGSIDRAGAPSSPVHTPTQPHHPAPPRFLI